MSLPRKENFYLLMIIACLFPALLIGQETPIFKEAEGLVIIEMESAVEETNWEVDKTIPNYTGSSYLHYKGSDHFNNPGNSLIKFKVNIEKSGTYRFQWRSRIAVGSSNTEHNDSWLRFKDASDFYGQKGEEKVYPKGVGKTPNPEGSTKDGWMKIYQNTRGSWTWQTRTSDNDPHEIYVEFDTSGTYSLEISGRSAGHAIDRMVLYHSEVNFIDATSLNNPESERIETVSTSELGTKTSLKINPTLARDFITLVIPDDLKQGLHEVLIFNLSGQLMQSFIFQKAGSVSPLIIQIDELSAGYYIVKFSESEIQYQGRFIKQ